MLESVAMRQAVLLSCTITLAVICGCGGALNGASDGSGGAGGSAEYGGAGSGGHGNGGFGGASYGGSSLGGSGCQALQVKAQDAADLSCQIDNDCIHPPHTAGDCTECGVVLNAANQESSLASVRIACLPFYEQGCVMALHSCFATTLHCNSGTCKSSIP